MFGKSKKFWLLISALLVVVITLIPITSPVLAMPISEPVVIPLFNGVVVPPVIVTGNATSVAISKTGVISGYLNATVTSLGTGDTSGQVYYFQYGPSAEYGTLTTNATYTTTGSKKTTIPRTLTIGSTYHFRAAAKFKSGAGAATGADNTFILTAPTVTTSAASSVTVTSAGYINGVFNGNITGMGSCSSVYAYFDYGLTNTYGLKTSQVGKTTAGAYTAKFPTKGILPGYTYHYRSVLKIGTNYVYGADQTFGYAASIYEFDLSGEDVTVNSLTSGNVTNSALSTGRVPYASTGGILVDSTNLTFSSATTGTLTTGTFSGALNGNASTATTATNVSGGTVSGSSVTDSGISSGQVVYTGTGGLLSGETGYEYNAGTDTLTVGHLTQSGTIASGEMRSVAGNLASGNTNAISFYWHNPNTADIYVTKVVVDVTTPGGTGSSTLQVGIADDATGTNLGSEFFTGLDLNNIALNDSWNSTDTGAMLHFVLCQDSVSATDGYIVGKITNANAASLVGKYYIFYVGR